MDYSIRALGASLFIVGMMLLTLYCLYKYAVCKEKKNKGNTVISVIPRTYSHLEVKNINTPVIIIS